LKGAGKGQKWGVCAVRVPGGGSLFDDRRGTDHDLRGDAGPAEENGLWRRERRRDYLAADQGAAARLPGRALESDSGGRRVFAAGRTLMYTDLPVPVSLCISGGPMPN